MNVSDIIKEINILVSMSKYDEALQKIQMLKDENEINEDIYYEEALIYVNLKEYNKALEICRLGLQYNPESSRFYSLLGIIFDRKQNKNMACICYEEAEKLCKSNNDNIGALKNIESINLLNADVKKLSIIIFADNNYEITKICLDSINKYSYDIPQIIIIDYNSSDGRFVSFECQENVSVISVSKKGILSACNDALMKIGYDRDVVIIDSRTILMPNTLFTLRMALYEDASNIAASAVSNNGDDSQFIDISCTNFNKYADFASKNNIINYELHYEVSKAEIFCTIFKCDFLLSIGLFNEKYIEINNNKVYFKSNSEDEKNIICKDSFVYRIL